MTGHDGRSTLSDESSIYKQSVYTLTSVETVLTARSIELLCVLCIVLAYRQQISTAQGSQLLYSRDVFTQLLGDSQSLLDARPLLDEVKQAAEGRKDGRDSLAISAEANVSAASLLGSVDEILASHACR